MLQRIRDRISGWIAGVIIALVAGAFMLFGVEYYFDQNSSEQNEVATVNGVTITDTQVNQAFSQLQRQTLAEMGGHPLTDPMTQQLKAYALQSLVTQTALFTSLTAENFRVGMPQIKMMVEQAPEFQDQGKFSEEKFMQALYRMNTSPQQFFQRVQSQWVVSQVTNSIASSAFALQSEVNHWYGLQHQQRAFGYMIVPMQNFVSQIQVTDADIKNNYALNQTEYQTPAKVSVSYIVLSPAAIEKSITITASEAEQYYQSHLANYQVPERWQVMQITIPVAANATAAETQAARAKANVIVSAFQDNKNTGFSSTTVTLSAAEVDQSLREMLTTLQPDKVSVPIRTPNGFTLLKLLKTEPAQTHAFDSVKNNVMQLLQHQRVNEILTKESSQLADLTYTNPDSLEIAAKTLNLPIQTSPMMTQADNHTGVFANPDVMKAVFSDSVFKSGNNSAPIDLADGSRLVLRVLKKDPSQPIPLETVRDLIKQKLVNKEATAQAGLLAYQLQKKLSDGADPITLAKQNGLQWHSVALTDDSVKSAVPKDILKAAFSTPVSAANSKKSMRGVQSISYDQQDYAVIDVTQTENANASSASVSTDKQLSLQLTVLWGQLLQHCFVDSVMSNAHIVIKKAAQ